MSLFQPLCCYSDSQAALGKSNNHPDYFYPSVTDKTEYGCGVFLRAGGAGGAAGAAGAGGALLTVENSSGQNSTLLPNVESFLYITFSLSHTYFPFFF